MLDFSAGYRGSILVRGLSRPVNLAARSKVNDHRRHLYHAIPVASYDKYLEKRKSVLERFLRKIDICTNLMYIYYITVKLAIFSTGMLWESCSKFNLEQLSHSMSVENIASLAIIY